MKIHVAGLLFIILYTCCTAMPRRREDELCRIRSRERVECGWSGITEETCKSMDCCWDRNTMTMNIISCYKSGERTSSSQSIGLVERLNHFQGALQPVIVITGEKESSARSCPVEPFDQVDCGWDFISRELCESRGCCFEESLEGDRCYYAESFPINPTMQNMLECTWECAKTSWKKIADGYTRCGTNSACWILYIGRVPGKCLSSCKANEDMLTYLSDVIDCLELSENEALSTYQECDTRLPCWRDWHGIKALKCFKQSRGKHGSTETSNETEEETQRELNTQDRATDEHGVPATPPPAEPSHIPPKYKPRDKTAERTHEDVEVSIHHQTDDESRRIQEIIPPEESEDESGYSGKKR